MSDAGLRGRLVGLAAKRPGGGARRVAGARPCGRGRGRRDRPLDVPARPSDLHEAGPDARHAGRHGDRAGRPGADLGRVPGSRAGRRGIRHRSGRRPDPLVHRPDRRHPQLRPRRAALRDALAVERDGELQAAVLSAPALRERWWARRGGGAWARGADDEEPRRIRVSRGRDARRRAGAVRLRRGDRRRRAARPGFRGLLRDAWRERGFGDFWGYALLAEGAAEAMVEVGLSSWDAAAPLVLVEEAGGRATDFDGRRAIDAGTFVATNGLLHDEVLARLREPLDWERARHAGAACPIGAAGRDAADQTTARRRRERSPRHRRTCRSARAADPDDRALEPALAAVARWTETFARASMFLATLSAGDRRARRFAGIRDGQRVPRRSPLVILPVVLFIGLATAVRVAQADADDGLAVQGMNRIRHAYLEMVPELEPYFVTSQYDDVAGDHGHVRSHTGGRGADRSTVGSSAIGGLFHGFVTATGMIVILNVRRRRRCSSASSRRCSAPSTVGAVVAGWPGQSSLRRAGWPGACASSADSTAAPDRPVPAAATAGGSFRTRGASGSAAGGRCGPPSRRRAGSRASRTRA